jgi:hypothetical protein
MNNRPAALILTAIFLLAALPVSVMALPYGWWPLWSAYTEALDSGNEDALISAGDNVIKYYSDKPMDGDIAGQLYSVYHTRLDRLIFENRGNYDAAADNCKKLTEICEYLNSLGNNYDDMITRCRHHLAVLTPQTGVYAVSHTQYNSYGSKYAPPSGTYYGTNAEGSFGSAGICSFYVELEGNTAAEFDYLIAKEFSTLTMVFPEVKAIVCFDKAVPEGDYTLSGSVFAAADAAISANPALIKYGNSAAGTWVPLDTFSETVSGDLLLGAAGRTYNRMDISAEYKLNGSQIASTSGSPNHCRINADELSAGRHKLEIVLGDGFGYSKTYTYTLNKDTSGTIAFTEGYLDTAVTFTDIDSSAYYYNAVLWSVDNGVTAGTSASTFSPDSACTRGQVVTFLWRAMGNPEPIGAYNPFTDVNAADYFYKPVLWAVEQGIASGTGADAFSPDDSCTNAHIITFLWRTMGKPGNTDSQVWYEDAVNWAVNRGLLTGIGKEFITGENCPRADVVTFLYRILAK